MDEISNVITTKTGVEIYENDIYILADDYIQSLGDNADIRNANKALFTGMIKHIYNNTFRINKLDYNDIDTLNNLFDIYTSLCYRYNKKPTVLNFTLMIGIDKLTIDRWLNSTVRSNIYYNTKGERIYNLLVYKQQHPGEEIRQEASSSHSNSVKRWLSECESALLDGVAEQNSIGCMFALKANYGYRDNVVVNIQETETALTDRSREQIAQNYGIAIDEKPEITPDF